MKTTIILATKHIITDRLTTALTVLFVLLCLAYCIYVGVSLRPSDLQVAVHYTAFGEATFYREKWYYLISLIVFGLMIAVTHTALIIKVHLQGHRQLAISFAWLSILLVVIAWLMTRSVLNIAFL